MSVSEDEPLRCESPGCDRWDREHEEDEREEVDEVEELDDELMTITSLSEAAVAATQVDVEQHVEDRGEGHVGLGVA